MTHTLLCQWLSLPTCAGCVDNLVTGPSINSKYTNKPLSCPEVSAVTVTELSIIGRSTSLKSISAIKIGSQIVFQPLACSDLMKNVGYESWVQATSANGSKSIPYQDRQVCRAFTVGVRFVSSTSGIVTGRPKMRILCGTIRASGFSSRFR